MSDIKTNNVWLMKGDCLERMKEIESGSVDLILTDPPYGTTACKWDSVIPLEPMWEQLNRILNLMVLFFCLVQNRSQVCLGLVTLDNINTTGTGIRITVLILHKQIKDH